MNTSLPPNLLSAVQQEAKSQKFWGNGDEHDAFRKGYIACAENIISDPSKYGLLQRVSLSTEPLPSSVLALVQKQAEVSAIESSEGYCKADNHEHDCNCSAYEQGFEHGASFLFNLLKETKSAGVWVKLAKRKPLKSEEYVVILEPETDFRRKVILYWDGENFTDGVYDFDNHKDALYLDEQTPSISFAEAPINYDNLNELARDVWLFLTKDHRLKQAVIKREAFLHEVKAMLESARQVYAKKRSISVLTWLASLQGDKKIVLIDGNWYWERDHDGDCALTEDQLYELFEKDQNQQPEK